MVKIQLIDIDHPIYQKERVLRNEVLLRPIGLPDHAWEMKDAQAWHFVAMEDDILIGCVLLAPLNEAKSKAQLMQMAVNNNFQGRGIGRLLVDALFAFCASNNVTEVTCHARATVVDFYTKLGFTVYGEPFEEVGISHKHMRIQIA